MYKGTFANSLLAADNVKVFPSINMPAPIPSSVFSGNNADELVGKKSLRGAGAGARRNKLHRPPSSNDPIPKQTPVNELPGILKTSKARETKRFSGVATSSSFAGNSDQQIFVGFNPSG